ncbi:MAG: phosphoadenosine phosphosulfate reductase [Elainella sp. Prado103]|nr:phosphoadenosine phosphosulfate reductase [Elainella sp. Prado103]
MPQNPALNLLQMPISLPSTKPTKISQLDLEWLNRKFTTAEPIEILTWCVQQIPTGLVQTSAFSVNGMAITDLLYRQLRPIPPIPVIFLDTLHHFPETLDLVAKAQAFYRLDLRIYQTPHVQNQAEFADRYGAALWVKDVQQFHQITKIEPLQRALRDLQVSAWITGRRRDQSSTRSDLPVFERDKQGRLKVNPLVNWTQKDSWRYVMEHGLMYNSLYDQGYASIGDQPLTTPIAVGEEERAGRWRGSQKTECGIHLAI